MTDLAIKVDNNTLVSDCQTVLATYTPLEREIWTQYDGVSQKEKLQSSSKLNREATTASNTRSSSVDSSQKSSCCFLRRIVPYLTNGIKIEGVVVSFVDITERITADFQARRLATVLRDSNDAIIVQTFDGDFVAWNRGAERMYGYSEKEAFKLKSKDYVPDDKWIEAAEVAHRILLEQPVEPFESQRKAKDGRCLDVQLTVAAYRDEFGKPIGIVSTERDISQHKVLLRKLQHLNADLENRVAKQVREVRLLAHAISHLAEGVMITEGTLDFPGPKILFVNDALCRMTGYTQEELVGSTPHILYGPLTNLESLEFITRELSSNRACTVELVNYQKDGTSYDNELFISPLFDEQGNRINFVSIQRDVSERARAKTALWQNLSSVMHSTV
ncbi:MAG: PAS domain S-box protein [Pirellulaceae bacterium]|nr:PAS domain S-box protein [Pirellulaceae bacterium]